MLGKQHEKSYPVRFRKLFALPFISVALSEVVVYLAFSSVARSQSPEPRCHVINDSGAAGKLHHDNADCLMATLHFSYAGL